MSKTKIAINGFGRIGRLVTRAAFGRNDIEVVAINDLFDTKTNAHLFKHDSVHGKFPGEVGVSGEDIIINGKKVHVTKEKDPNNLPWGKLEVDIVCECTGVFTSKEKAKAHINAGAKKVIISAPGGEDVDATIVYGVNHKNLKASDTVISNASCTTNCLAPVCKVINDVVGIKKGLMTTIHSYTNDQNVLDLAHKDLRRARAAALNMIPTSTGAAKAIGLVIPELKGKLNGFAIRVPTPNVSVVDLTFEAAKATTVEEINQAIKKAATGDLKGILGYNDEPLVSSDFNHNPLSSILDVDYTSIIDGNLVKILAWYDNEWGFSNRMLDVATVFMNAK